MRALVDIASFELRQQLRGHVFWIVFVISALMVAGALWVPELRVAIGGDMRVDAPDTIVRTHLLWSLFYMFTAAAFVADAVLRDEITGFAPIVRSTPVSWPAYVLGRFGGAFAATLICFLSVPAAMLLALADPALSWARLPSSAFLTGFFVVGVPNLLVSAALFFVLSTWSRSMLGTLIGSVALLSLYGAGVEPGGGTAWALLEPFGFTAWSQAEHTPGLLLLNRALWVSLGAFGIAAVALAPARTQRTRQSRPAGVVAALVRPSGMELPAPSFGPSTAIRQLAARAAFELRQLLFAPSFLILLILGLGNAAATIWRLVSADPLADAAGITAALIDAFDLVPIVVAIFFAGELAWNEREHKVDELIGASAIPNSAMLVPKLLALALALLALALASAGAALAVPGLFGVGGPTVTELFDWYILPRTLDWLLIGTLALFFQAVSPTKLAGWGLSVLFLVATLALDQAGFQEPIYHYGRYPGSPLPPALSRGEATGWYRLYWGALATLLMVLGDAAYAQGRQGSGRLATAKARLGGARGLVAACAGVTFAGLGAFLGRV
jgi:ABC-type transport system involved in multi-copper enzyme maturation permease subunit